MSDISNELNDILADFAKQSMGGDKPTEQPTEVDTGTPQDVVDPITEPIEPSNPKDDTKKLEEPVKKDEPKPVDEPTSFDDWDSEPEPDADALTKTEVPVEIFSELGKALGLEEAKGKEDLVRAIASLKQEAEQAKGPDKSKIRPELLKAIELDEKGGDFYEYLKVTSVDYSQSDPIELYEDYVIDQLSSPDGTVDFDKVNDYLDNLNESEKRLKGIELQKRLMYEQKRRVAEIEQDAIIKRQKTDAELKAALTGLQEIDGFKVQDKHRKEAFDWVASGKMMQDLFYGPDGNLDPVKVAKNAFRNLYYAKLDAYQKSKIRNSTKREVFADITNQQITTPSIPSNPQQPKGNPLDEYIKSLESGLGNR